MIFSFTAFVIIWRIQIAFKIPFVSTPAPIINCTTASNNWNFLHLELKCQKTGYIRILLSKKYLYHDSHLLICFWSGLQKNNRELINGIVFFVLSFELWEGGCGVAAPCINQFKLDWLLQKIETKDRNKWADLYRCIGSGDHF